MDELDNAAAQQTPSLPDKLDIERVNSSTSASKQQTKPLQTDKHDNDNVTPLTRHIYEFIEK